MKNAEVVASFRERVEEMKEEVEGKPFEEIDFGSRLGELRTMMGELAPLIESLKDFLPQEDVNELNEALKETNFNLDNMDVELAKLKQLQEDENAFFEAIKAGGN